MDDIFIVCTLPLSQKVTEKESQNVTDQHAPKKNAERADKACKEAEGADAAAVKVTNDSD